MKNFAYRFLYPTTRPTSAMLALRTVIVLVTFPFVRIADWLRGYDPPSRLRTGLDWAKGRGPNDY